MDSEHALRVHARQLLLNYALNYLTADYIQLTEQAVLDLDNQYLTTIPTTDPNSLILPTDPYETLTRIHGLGSLEAFQERFQSTPDAIQCIKKLLKPEKPKSDRVFLQESNFESCSPVWRPMSPILTSHARRETPKPGSNNFFQSLPASHPEFLTSQSIKPIENEPVIQPLVKPDLVLNCSWQLHQKEHDAVRSLLNSAVMIRGHKNRHLDLDPSARPDSPPIPPKSRPEPPFMPIFPRRQRVRGGVREADPPPSGLKGVASLPAVILPPVKVEEIEPELYKQNMVIVNGWHAYHSSPSPTPPSSQESDQIDELFRSTPDTTPPPVYPTKMELPQIPRVRRIGGVRKKTSPIGHGKDFGSFITPLVQKAPVWAPLSTEPATSMLGQPDSPSTVIKREELDHDIEQLYGHQRKNPGDFIRNEKLDTNEQLLFDIPALPPPNEHAPNALFLPLNLANFVQPLKAKGQAAHATHQFLKKAKGIPSLNVELSWVPVAAKTRIPSHSEVLKVTDLFDADAADLVTEIVILLERIPAMLDSAERETCYIKMWPEDDMPVEPFPLIAPCHIALSRKERRRAAGLADEVEEDDIDSDDSLEDPLFDVRGTKRPRLAQDEFFDDSGVSFEPFDLAQDMLTGYIDPHDVDKENIPPFTQVYERGDFEQLNPDDVSRSPFASQMDYAMQECQDFEILSFDSAQPTQLAAPPTDYSDETYSQMFEPHPTAIVNDSAVVTKPPSLALEPDMATHSLGISEFAKLRAKKVSGPVPEKPLIPQDTPQEPSHDIPDNIYDRNTLRLPSSRNPPQTLHRYMVSMDLVQKQALVRILRSRACAVDLIERNSLDGVDIILDPHTAIIFTNLLTLPSECADLVTRVCQQSWLYSRLLVIFDAYPAARSYQPRTGSSNAASELFAYSPPVLKALGKLRRDVGIQEACEAKRRDCVVQYAFADTVEEAAMVTRYFGDLAEASDESHALWGDRAWLDDDVPEGEQDLAAADGMNRFAAFVILCQIDLEEFLDLNPEERVNKFGGFVGLERMLLLNQVIERRLRAMEPSDFDVGMMES
ncbi:hypothetical protein FB45DRAFT_940310 [Roridomyces roridus]|uniref:Uncharacterized protein n=1 Tax=Roridomyces roridus TaxID=1738132 RepID=A0AAD7B6P3_9AGAR|nr:hypothetical protein FB45DRAFT_940310 [Roridomyces roridus]